MVFLTGRSLKEVTAAMLMYAWWGSWWGGGLKSQLNPKITTKGLFV
jgi:hypothetical protein